jgi:hypothetical protein
MMSNLNMEIAAAPESEMHNSADCGREFELLLAAARIVPDEARIDALAGAGIDWSALLDLAGSHGVRPMVYKSLRETCWRRIPAQMQAAWDEVHQLLTGRSLFLTGELLRVTAEFRNAGVTVAAIKGPVIAQMAYGDFTLREFSDLDLLVHENNFSRAVELITQLGYEPFWKLDSRRVLRFLRHMGEYKLSGDFPGVDIDLHWKPAHDSVALSPALRDFPSGFQPLPLAGSTVPTFAPQDLPLYLASQGGGDQWGDLRRICDLAEFLRRFPDVDWEPHFQTARRLGGLRSMLTGLALARNLLGATLPGSAARRIQSDATVTRLAERVTKNLRRQADPGEGATRYLFQLRARRGVRGRMALAYHIFTDRTTEDGSWRMLPRPLWWAYNGLRPLRMASKLLRRN